MDILSTSLSGLVITVVIVLTLLNTFYTVRQQEAAIVDRFGKFVRASRAGLKMKIPFLENLRTRRFSLRVEQTVVVVETITKDKVPVKLNVAVQHYVADDNASIRDAFYRLAQPRQQIESYVFNTTRARVPTLNLDELFEKQDEIASAIEEHLGAKMKEFGYTILTALVNDIDPDAKVKAAMADINAAQREQAAATARGETQRILDEKKGEGIAAQRTAIIRGLKAALEELRTAMPDTEANEAMLLVLVAQYFDTLKELGREGKTNTIFLPGNPGGVGTMVSELRNALMAANVATN